MYGAPIPSTNIAHMVRVLFFILLLAGCQSGGEAINPQKSSSSISGEASGGSNMSFSLQSPSFSSGRPIPKKFSCEGSDTSPALQWAEPPANTQSFVLIADDPDAPAGTWTHWVAYDLPASLRQLPEGVSKQAGLAQSGAQGINDFGKTGYGGPCPPPGKPHRYFFKLYALDAKLNLKPGAGKQQVESAMQGHVLGKAELMGTHQR
jgi:Raf kinase inhibitor-like YbhB/YbcL family protein